MKCMFCGSENLEKDGSEIICKDCQTRYTSDMILDLLVQSQEVDSISEQKIVSPTEQTCARCGTRAAHLEWAPNGKRYCKNCSNRIKEKVGIVLGIIAFFMFVAIATILIVVLPGVEREQQTSNNAYHNTNVSIVKSRISDELGEQIVQALEQTSIVGETSTLNSDYIIKVDNGCYDVYIGFIVRITIDGDNFQMITWEEDYNSQYNIVLYDSKSGYFIMLSEEEKASIRYTQRRATVHSTISITAKKQQQAPKYAYLQLAYNNHGSAIVYLNVVITPYLSGKPYIKNYQYLLSEPLPACASTSKDVTIDNCYLYDKFVISSVALGRISDTSSLHIEPKAHRIRLGVYKNAPS